MNNDYTSKEASLAYRTIAMEASVLTNLKDSILSKFAPIRGFLANSFSFASDVPKEDMALTKKEAYYVKRMTGAAYMACMKLKVSTAPGWNANFSDIKPTIEEILSDLKNFNKDVLDPYNLYLSLFISNKDAKLTNKDTTYIYKKLQHKREGEIAHRAKYISDHSNQGEMAFGKLLPRGGDLAHAFDHINKTRKSFLQIDLKDIKQGIAKSCELIDEILNDINNGNTKNITKEMALSMSAGCYELAQQAEFISSNAVILMNYLGLGNNLVISLEAAEKEGLF